MTRDDIIRMAREADDFADSYTPQYVTLPHEWQEIRDKRFFHLAYAAGATDERQFIINFLESMHERCLGQHNYYLHAAKLISNLPSAKPTKSS